MKLTAEQLAYLDVERERFREENGRDMTSDDVPFSSSFKRGHVAMDEPPGFEERYYQLWLFLIGKVQQRVVTADDL